MTLVSVITNPSGKQERTYCNGRDHETWRNDVLLKTEKCQCFKPSFRVETIEPNKSESSFHYLPNESLD